MMRYVLVAVLAVFPFTSHAAPMFSEIAWMGTDTDANNEWIEIYNFGTDPVDLTGWTITGGGSLNIALSGTLGPHGVGVLERTDDSSVPSVTALLVYTGAMANTGDSAALTLTLRDPSNAVVDEVVGGADWSLIGGSNTVPKKTAQRTRMNTWVTAAPTPGDQNAQVSDPVTTGTGTTTGSTSSSTTTHTVKKSSSSKKVTAKLDMQNAELTITLNHPEAVYAGRPATFSVTPSGIGSTIMNSLVYTWNFGDTYTGGGKSVTHTYKHPGTYLLVLEAVYRSRSVILEYPVKVLPMNFTLDRNEDRDLVITNKTESTIDVSGYTLRGTISFVFPKLSRIPAGSSLVVDKSRIGEFATNVSLTDLRGQVVATEGQLPMLASREASRTFSAAAPSSKSSASVAAAFTSETKPTAVLMSDTEDEGIVAGTSTTMGGLTIPVYAAEGDVEGIERDSRSYLPYAGLIALIVVGVVLLYRRPHGDA